MKFEVKSLDIVSVIKVCFVIYAILGILVGLIVFLMTLVTGVFMGQSPDFGYGGFSRLAATGFGVLLIPLFALMYGCIGAFGGLIVSLVYNIVTKVIGGIKITLVGEPPAEGLASAADKGMEVRL
jgi:hypothetical protein